VTTQRKKHVIPNEKESTIAAVSRVLSRETGFVPSNVLAMMLIEAVRETTPPPREVTLGMLSKILRSLEPTQALDAWASRASREIVKILSGRPEIQRFAARDEDEHLWCTLEGVIAGLLIRVCCGQDLDKRWYAELGARGPAERGIRTDDAVTSIGGAPIAVRAWPGEYVIGLAEHDAASGATIKFRGTTFRVGDRPRTPPANWCHPPGMCHDQCPSQPTLEKKNES
jgi:hypothetical protein